MGLIEIFVSLTLYHFDSLLYASLTVILRDKVKIEKTGSAMILSTKGDYVFYNRPERIGKNKDYMKDPNTQKIFKDEILSKDQGSVQKKLLW